MSELAVKKKIPMVEAAQMLAELCDRLDAGEEPGAALQQVFKETQLELAEAVDRRKAFKAIAEAQIAVAKDAIEGLRAHVRRLEGAVESLKENTKAVLEAHPDLPYKDSFGRKLSLCPSPPKLVLAFELRDKKTISNIVDLAACELVGVDSKYLCKAHFIVLDVASVKADLEAGVELPWARLERSSHVRGL